MKNKIKTKSCYLCGCVIYKAIRCSCFKGNPRYNHELTKNVEPDLKGNRTRLCINKGFYMSRPWRRLKKAIIRLYGPFCMRCKTKGIVHVDHIKPRSKNPSLELNPWNLQVLCSQCNQSKGNVTKKDYRSKNQKEKLKSTKNKVILEFLNGEISSRFKKKRKAKSYKKKMKREKKVKKEKTSPKTILRKAVNL